MIRRKMRKESIATLSRIRASLLSLAGALDGMLYGITDNEKVFVFDSERRVIKKVFDLGLKNPREISLQLGPDFKLYGLAREAIFSIDPKNDQVSLVANPSSPIHSGMAILNHTIYFGSGANLWEFEIPIDPNKPVE